MTIWTPTMALRWRKRDKENSVVIKHTNHVLNAVLEQLWQGSDGSQQWRPVGIVEYETATEVGPRPE